jgi:hypothetical protein
MPGQGGAARQQGGLVGLDGEQVVGVLVADQELGGLRVGLQRVGGDHGPGEVEVGQQWGEGGDLLGCAADLALGQHRAGGVVHAGQQVRPAAVAACPAGAAQGFAVDGDRPPSAGCGSGTAPVPLRQPRADRSGQGVGVQAGKGPADGGLGRDGEVTGGVAAGAECGPDRLGRIGGPLGDRGDRPCAAQHRGGGQAQDGDQRMATATGSSRVRDGGEVGEQVRGVGGLRVDRVGAGEVGEGGWDRG